MCPPGIARSASTSCGIRASRHGFPCGVAGQAGLDRLRQVLVDRGQRAGDRALLRRRPGRRRRTARPGCAARGRSACAGPSPDEPSTEGSVREGQSSRPGTQRRHLAGRGLGVRLLELGVVAGRRAACRRRRPPGRRPTAAAAAGRASRSIFSWAPWGLVSGSSGSPSRIWSTQGATFGEHEPGADGVRAACRRGTGPRRRRRRRGSPLTPTDGDDLGAGLAGRPGQGVGDGAHAADGHPRLAGPVADRLVEEAAVLGERRVVQRRERADQGVAGRRPRGPCRRRTAPRSWRPAGW